MYTGKGGVLFPVFLYNDIKMARKTTKIYDIAYIGISVALLTICSWITIPVTVPFTLQTFAVFFTVIILGGKCGSIAVWVYLLLGTVGLPVFSGFGGGVGYIMGSTGGYLLGLGVIALVMWLFELFLGKKSIFSVCSMCLGLIACYTLGTLHFVNLYTANTGYMGVWVALSQCVFPFIIPDILKMILALTLAKRVRLLR